MKKIIFYGSMIISIIILAYFCKLHFDKKEALTKNSIWSIIDSIDEALLSSICKTGSNELTDEAKLDFITKYLIENRKKYSEDILESDSTLQKDGTTYYNFGKVKSEYFYARVKDFFSSFNYDINSSEVFNNGYIELFYEPTEHISCDSKRMIDFKVKREYAYVNVCYTRILAQKTNEFYVEYTINKEDLKIKNVKIYNSSMN